MAFIKRDVKDRVVQYPNRYKLKDTTTGNVIAIYDLEADTGTVIEAGTAINKAYLQPIEDALANGSNESYLAFCANVNTASLDAAFGKNNEDRISGIGRQLAMYAWFKGDSKITYPFTNLLSCDTLDDCFSNAYAFGEIILENNYIVGMLNTSPYAKTKFDTAKEDSVKFAKALVSAVSLNPANYANMDIVIADNTAFNSVCNISSLVTTIFTSTMATDKIVASSVGMNTLTANTTSRGLIGFSGTAYQKVALSDMAIGKYVAALAGLTPSSYANMTGIVSDSVAMTQIVKITPALKAIVYSLLAVQKIEGSTTAKNALNISPLKTTFSATCTGSWGVRRSGKIWLISYNHTGYSTGTYSHRYTINGNGTISSYGGDSYQIDYSVNRFMTQIENQLNSSNTGNFTYTIIPCE